MTADADIEQNNGHRQETKGFDTLMADEPNDHKDPLTGDAKLLGTKRSMRKSKALS